MILPNDSIWQPKSLYQIVTIVISVVNHHKSAPNYSNNNVPVTSVCSEFSQLQNYSTKWANSCLPNRSLGFLIHKAENMLALQLNSTQFSSMLSCTFVQLQVSARWSFNTVWTNVGLVWWYRWTLQEPQKDKLLRSMRREVRSQFPHKYECVCAWKNTKTTTVSPPKWLPVWMCLCELHFTV